MTFNFWGRILYFVDASCFDTSFQKMLSGKMCFALLFPSPSPSQERHVFDSLSLVLRLSLRNKFEATT